MKTIHKILIAICLVALGVVSRLAPHLWNMTPIAGVAILAGARLGMKWGVGVALVSMFLGDLIIGFYAPAVMVAVYVCIALSGVIGYLVKKTQKTSSIVIGSAIGTTIFFFVTNWAVWQWTPMYSHNLGGLLTSYLAGLPFFTNQILGDMFFTVSLFAIWELGKSAVERFKLKYSRQFI